MSFTHSKITQKYAKVKAVMKNNKNLFGANFLWGASTASHQVEGGNHNQWSVWELENAKDLASSAKERLDWLPDWDRVKFMAEDPNNYISGRGVDHYKRYEQDFDIAQKLNLNSFRFGIEWARLEPKEGEWDQKEIEHFRKYIQELKKRNIEPIMNIWHWTNPVWFEEKGGFTKRENIKCFEKFVHRIAKEFGNEINYVITLNEPNVYMSHSYGIGWWPPQQKKWHRALWVYYNLSVAHKRAYRILKHKNKRLMIGIAPQLANIQPKRPQNPIDYISTKWMMYFWNWWFLNRIRKYQDFIGFNYYFTDYYKNLRAENPDVPKNDLGWYMEPEGLHPLLVRVWSQYRKPIIITENGVADRDDKYRRWWIEQSIIAMERAISEGVHIAGYLHWSLLDNFEWAYGWWPKFGLVSVDRENGMKREIRSSAKWYAKKIKQLKDD